MRDKKINMYRTHQEAAGVAAKLTAEEELRALDKHQPPSKYHVKNIWKDEEWVDFYMMYDQCRIGKPHQIGDSAIEHAWKKITQAGERSGGKSRVQDIKEAIDSLEKALDMMEKAGARIEGV